MSTDRRTARWSTLVSLAALTACMGLAACHHNDDLDDDDLHDRDYKKKTVTTTKTETDAGTVKTTTTHEKKVDRDPK